MKETIEVFVEPFLSFQVEVRDIQYSPASTNNPMLADSDWNLQDHLEYSYDVVEANESLDTKFRMWRYIEGPELSDLVKEYSQDIDKLVKKEVLRIVKGDKNEYNPS